MSEDYTLSFERQVDLSPEELFEAWTKPDIMMQWFCPRPWKTVYAKVELRAGGAFDTIMEGPEGEKNEGQGCVLDFELNRKLVWTNLMRQDFIPNEIPQLGFGFVATIAFIPQGTGALYKASVRHSDEAGMKTHDEMGFYEGWNAAFDQLIELYTH